MALTFTVTLKLESKLLLRVLGALLLAFWPID
jgi:hypothetical protein